MVRRIWKTARSAAGLCILAAALFLPPAPAPAGGDFLTGHFLIATEALTDPNFTRSVVYICRHDAKGALGLVLNRPMGKLPLAELLKPFGIESADKREIVIGAGGPVQRHIAMILHTTDVMAGEPLCRTEKGAITGTVEMLRAMNEGKGPRRAKVYFGYSGWGAGQLEREMTQKSWQTIPEDAGLLFGEDMDGMWEKAKGQLGVEL
jgi:putative transcriptional regulator